MYDYYFLKILALGHLGNIVPSSVIRNENVVSFLDQTYKPDLGYTHEKIDTILDSILNQHAMKLDTTYEDNVSKQNKDL